MNPDDFQAFSLQAKHEREAREWQEWDQTITPARGSDIDWDLLAKKRNEMCASLADQPTVAVQNGATPVKAKGSTS